MQASQEVKDYLGYWCLSGAMLGFGLGIAFLICGVVILGLLNVTPVYGGAFLIISMLLGFVFMCFAIVFISNLKRVGSLW